MVYSTHSGSTLSGVFLRAKSVEPNTCLYILFVGEDRENVGRNPMTLVVVKLPPASRECDAGSITCDASRPKVLGTYRRSYWSRLLNQKVIDSAK